jgi:hypothetical protein
VIGGKARPANRRRESGAEPAAAEIGGCFPGASSSITDEAAGSRNSTGFRAAGFNEAPPLRPIMLLLLVPFVALAWVPLFNRIAPELLGFPFFYWYQLAFVPITSLLTYIVYKCVRHDR